MQMTMFDDSETSPQSQKTEGGRVMAKAQGVKRAEIIERCKEAFLEWIDNAEFHVFLEGTVYDDEGRAFEVTTEHSDLWICGVLWDCEQKLPDAFCEKLGLPVGATYKAAARKIRPDAAIFWKSQPDFVALDEPLRDSENWLKV